MNAMLASDLPLPRIGRGKVRDIYAVGDDRVLLLTTDRISAFDVVMAETIPMKGAVLTQISAWWFRQFEGVVPHHMLSADADEIIREVPALKDHRDDIVGRAMLCRRTTVFPVECVIREIKNHSLERADGCFRNGEFQQRHQSHCDSRSRSHTTGCVLACGWWRFRGSR
jgi:phosphoribosylaminoimidazole-succinocarboxamide synthase